MFYQIIERAPAMLIKVICISLLLISLVSNIYSQETTWFWQNPYPQGHNINGVKFIDQNTGIACGDYGTLLRTSDGGLTWKVSYVSEINNLSEIFFVNQLTGFIFPGYTTGNVFTYNIQKTTDGGLSWAPKNTGELIRYTTGVNFINENTGFACGMFQTTGGKVIKTTDSGESWSTILTNTTGFYDISFPDENNGYLLGNNSSMLRTTNSGVNWFEVTRITVNSAVSIFFTDSVTGYGIGGYPGFYKTTNGGMNWFSLGTASGIQIYFIDSERGYILGSSGYVRLTTNGGTDWYTFSSGIYIEAKSLNFGNENTGYIVGNNGRILKTNNGGFIWNLISNSVSYSSLFDVDFINSSTGFIFGANGTILKTTNSGNNWTSSQLLSSWDLGRAEFLNENTGYLCADSIVWKSRLYKTTNSGNVWNSVFYITSNNITSEFFTDPENGYIATSYYTNINGKIWKTTNGGSAWTEVFSLSASGLKSLSFVNPSTGFCCSSAGTIYKTTNQGMNWSPDVSIAVNNFFFTSEMLGYAVGPNASAYKTTNAGDNWSALNTGVPVTYNLTKLFFINDYSGYAIGNSTTSPVESIIIRTTNGGSEWTTLDSNHYGGLYGIFFTSSSSGIIAGRNGTILKTTDGGLTFAGEHNAELSQSFNLLQNYPNPFNPKTIIGYSLASGTFVSLNVYNVLGSRVASLVNEKKNPGYYSVEFDAADLPSGIYFYRIETEEFMEIKRMILIK